MELPDTDESGPPAARRMHPALLVSLRVFGTIGVILLITAAMLWNTLMARMPEMPSPDELWSLNREPAVEFLDASGATIAVRGPRYAEAVYAADLPPHVVNAIIAAEDKRFLEHDGVDFQAIVRAAFANVQANRTAQGGSTITQQLVKNLFLGQEQTIKRKAQEARLATDLERVLSKEEILNLYLNRVYFGSAAYGIEAAAQTYFGKSAFDLSVGEAALLAAFPKAPSRFAKEKSEPQTIARQHYVLDRMVEAGFITPAGAAQAKAQKLVFVEKPKERFFSGHALDHALKEAREVLPHAPSDLVIKLTLDLRLQRETQRAVEAALAAGDKGATEGAAILMENDGSIRAMVGGRDYATSQFNRATQARRQPGSVFKTFVYAAALENGFTPWMTRNDAPVRIGNWRPRNYRDDYRGQITIATALALSSNSVAAQVGWEIGPRRVADIARRFGVRSRLQAYPSISLGSDEVTLIEMTGAYGVLANSGLETRPHIIAEIRNSRGDLLYSAAGEDRGQVYARTQSEMMTAMLGNVVRFGTGRAAAVPGWQVAGKTGTSQSWRDAWFIGYTARYIGGVWIGNDNDRAMREVTGGSIAASVFSRFMTAAHRGLAPKPLPGQMPDQPLVEELYPTDEVALSSDYSTLLSYLEEGERDLLTPLTQDEASEVAVNTAPAPQPVAEQREAAAPPATAAISPIAPPAIAPPPAAPAATAGAPPSL